jgi:membrane-associated phospholipid phosphatase
VVKELLNVIFPDMLRTYIDNNFPTGKQTVAVILFSVLYLALVWYFIGLRPEHAFILILYNACFFAHVKSRKIVLALTIFLVFGILYDFMKVYPNYLVKEVDIMQLYLFDKNVFGIRTYGVPITINEYFNSHHSPILDFLAGLFYINWIPVPLIFALYLFFKNKKQFLIFSLTFLFVNIIGFCVYYIHPAAPPWYVQLYGFEPQTGVPGNTSGLSRFDALVGLPVFDSIYSRNSNVFAAMPSLHSAYPVIVLFFGIKNKLGKVNWLLGLFMIGIWFSAVYSGHHYVTDVIMGVACAVIGILIFQKVLLKIKFVDNWIEKYKNIIT